VSNHPKDAGDIVAPLDDGNGLLKGGGYSMNNWASGNAETTLLTFTAMNKPGGGIVSRTEHLYSFFGNTFAVQRAFIAMLGDIVTEAREARYQRIHDIQPRGHRGFPYPLVRAVSVVLLPQISCYLLISKLFEGVSAAYTTFVSYDEVAHHSGIDRPDAFRVLVALDKQIKWIVEARQYTDQPYEFVLLSDHGQSMGATFKQRYGISLKEYVNTLLDPAHQAEEGHGNDDGTNNVNMLLTQLASSDRASGRIVRRAFQGQTDEGGFVNVAPQDPEEAKKALDAKTILCASGNLALIYFTEFDHRMTLEEIEVEMPGLVQKLVNHAGVGFVMVRTSAGPVAIGKKGTYFLKTDKIEGENPLTNFGKNAALHLKTLDSYPFTGDLMLNSFYDPVKDEVAAFEELIGCHGGLGGKQNHPFVMYPAKFQTNELPEIVGAAQLHTILKGWRATLQGGTTK
jgi:putative membrane protein